MKLKRACYGYLISDDRASAVYVGISYDPTERFRSHREYSEKGAATALHREMRTRDMHLLIREKFMTVRDAKNWERETIAKIIRAGLTCLNESPGGEHPHPDGYDFRGRAFAICEAVKRISGTLVFDFRLERSDLIGHLFLPEGPCNRAYVELCKKTMRWTVDPSICVGRRFEVKVKDGRITKATIVRDHA